MDRRIKLLREALGLTQLEFANSLNIHDTTVSGWERGANVPEKSIVIISKLYGVNSEWLRAGKGEMFTAGKPVINEDFKNNIHYRLSTVRDKLNLTLGQFGDRLNVTGATISNWENNKIEIPEKQRERICKEFGVNRRWLETGEGEMLASEPIEDDVEADIKKVLEEKEVSNREYAKFHGCGDVTALIFENFMTLPPEEQDLFMQCYYKYWRDKARKS